MRILHVVPTYLPAGRYGGPIHSVHGLCKALSAADHEVHVVTTNVDGNGTSAVELGTAVDLDGVVVRYFESPFRRLYWSPAMKRHLAANVGGYDLLHLHSVFLWPTAAAAAAARAAGVPYVLSPRGMLEPGLIRQRSTMVKKAWISVVEKRNLQAAACVHVTSERERNELEALHLGDFGYAVIPNGVDANRIGLAPMTNRKPAQVLFLGRLNWKKGIDRLLAAIALIDNTELLIAGPDESGCRAHLEKQAQALGVSSRVRFVGAVSGAGKWRLLDEATVLVLPSRSENFGIVVIEALARGLPVVLSRDVGIAGAILEHGAGRVCDPEPEALARAIRDLLGSPRERAAMGERGCALVRERFTWDHVAAQMEGVYRSAIERRSAA